MSGCIHIYCGDGKGKTTAAIGLAVRVAGRGKRVLIVRFLKTDDSGEVVALAHEKNIEVQPCEKSFGFYSRMSDEQKAEARIYYRELLEKTWEKAEGEHYDMLILDEIMAACNYGVVEEERLCSLLKKKPESLEIVLTGRNPSDNLIAIADYVSEVRKIKHPFDQGMKARRGIEY